MVGRPGREAGLGDHLSHAVNFPFPHLCHRGRERWEVSWGEIRDSTGGNWYTADNISEQSNTQKRTRDTFAQVAINYKACIRGSSGKGLGKKGAINLTVLTLRGYKQREPSTVVYEKNLNLITATFWELPFFISESRPAKPKRNVPKGFLLAHVESTRCSCTLKLNSWLAVGSIKWIWH